MKTKMKLHLIIYITIVGFLTACENEIPYNPGQQDPQIIMNALLETGQAENDVYLHLGEGYSIEHLNEATLFLYINGKIAETPKAVSPEEIYGHLEGELDKDIYESLLKSIRFKKYRTAGELEALFAMTPYYWKTPRDGAARLAALPELTTDIAFRFLLFEKL